MRWKCGRIGFRSDVALSSVKDNFNRGDRRHDRVEPVRIAHAGIDVRPVAVHHLRKRNKIVPGKLLSRLEAN